MKQNLRSFLSVLDRMQWSTKPSHATVPLIECEPAEENHEDKLKPKKKQQAEKKPAKEVKAAFQHKVQRWSQNLASLYCTIQILKKSEYRYRYFVK